METVFGPGGALERALPGYEPRPEQAALAAAVESSLAMGEHLLAEAMGRFLKSEIDKWVPVIKNAGITAQ